MLLLMFTQNATSWVACFLLQLCHRKVTEPSISCYTQNATSWVAVLLARHCTKSAGLLFVVLIQNLFCLIHYAQIVGNLYKPL
jgi:hypothetical protein